MEKAIEFRPSNLILVIRVFLGILIVIGVVLLCTQGLWVPKLVDHILKTEQTYGNEAY